METLNKQVLKQKKEEQSKTTSKTGSMLLLGAAIALLASTIQATETPRLIEISSGLWRLEYGGIEFTFEPITYHTVFCPVDATYRSYSEMLTYYAGHLSKDDQAAIVKTINTVRPELTSIKMTRNWFFSAEGEDEINFPSPVSPFKGGSVPCSDFIGYFVEWTKISLPGAYSTLQAVKEAEAILNKINRLRE